MLKSKSHSEPPGNYHGGLTEMGDNAEALILSIDLGGTKILTAVINAQGKILSRDHSLTPPAKGQEAVIQAILESAGRARNQAGIAAADITAISIGAPGLSNPETGILFTSPNLPGWKNVPLLAIFERKFGKKVFLINDANAAAIGELQFGAGKGARNLIYITVSTGIGGGIIIDGKIYTGFIGTAGELGHMTIEVDGPLCNCGNRGCWESLASGTALAREARQRINERARTSLLDHAGGDPEKVSAEVIHQAAQAGDKLAAELITQTGYYLGVGLANLINIFNPERIIIGGGLSNIGDRLLKPAFKEAERRAFKEAYRVVRFASPQLGQDSGVIGAAFLALRGIAKRERE